MKKYCSWLDVNDKAYVDYHDNDWCIPKHDDKELFEFLVLESFQAGLSWKCILNKRKYFKEAFDNFNIDKIIKYDENKINELYNNKNIIRNKNKILSTINNAIVFKNIQKEYKSFDNYIWSFTNNKVIKDDPYKPKTELSKRVSKDLIKKGMKFVGPVIIYSYLQAIGIVNAHTKECYLYKEEL